MHNIFHIIMASLVFLSSTGMTINSHYCKDELKEVALFFGIDSCCPPSEDCEETNEEDKSDKFEQRSCCKDVSVYAQADGEQEQVNNIISHDLAAIILINKVLNIQPRTRSLPVDYYTTLHPAIPPPDRWSHQIWSQNFRC